MVSHVFSHDKATYSLGGFLSLNHPLTIHQLSQGKPATIPWGTMGPMESDPPQHLASIYGSFIDDLLNMVIFHVRYLIQPEGNTVWYK